MTRPNFPIRWQIDRLASLILVCAALTACNQGAGTKPAPVPAAQVPQAIELTDEIRARLVQADAADGKEDHVIAKCVTCSLKMPGDPAFTLVVGGYSVRLCSAGCKAQFEKDPAKALLALPGAAR